MATAVLHPDPQRFPAGATVKAYKRSNFPGVWDLTGAPAGSQDASATVASDGSVTFTGLTDDTAYVIYAASPDRYSSFRTPAIAAGGAVSNGLVPIIPFAGAAATVGVWSIFGASIAMGGWIESDAAQNDSIEWD